MALAFNPFPNPFPVVEGRSACTIIPKRDVSLEQSYGCPIVPLTFCQLQNLLFLVKGINTGSYSIVVSSTSTAEGSGWGSAGSGERVNQLDISLPASGPPADNDWDGGLGDQFQQYEDIPTSLRERVCSHTTTELEGGEITELRNDNFYLVFYSVSTPFHSVAGRTTDNSNYASASSTVKVHDFYEMYSGTPGTVNSPNFIGYGVDLATFNASVNNSGYIAREAVSFSSVGTSTTYLNEEIYSWYFYIYPTVKFYNAHPFDFITSVGTSTTVNIGTTLSIPINKNTISFEDAGAANPYSIWPHPTWWVIGAAANADDYTITMTVPDDPFTFHNF